MSDPVPEYFSRAHLAFRLLGLTGDRLEWLQLVTKAMADFPSAVIYPEQMIANKRFIQPHSGAVAEIAYKLYAVSFSSHASAVSSIVSHHDFSMVKLRNTDHLQGRATRTPATLLKWDMVGDILWPELKIANHLFASQPLQLGTFLPWKCAVGTQAGRGHDIRMLFAEKADAVRFATYLLAEQEHREFAPPSYMGVRDTLQRMC